jgi:hypothetical protein
MNQNERSITSSFFRKQQVEVVIQLMSNNQGNKEKLRSKHIKSFSTIAYTQRS